jgi:drug/metabolite transporter (DMT)-like permease
VTLFAALLIVVTVSCFVAGQILLKHAVDLSQRESYSRARAILMFAGAILAFTINFFLNIGLLQRFDLSYFFPFQGLSVIFITLAGAWILRERLTVRLTIGSLLIALGVALVSAT